MKAKELHFKMWEEAKHYEFKPGYFDLINPTDEYHQEVFHEGVHKDNVSRQYLACMARYLKPKHIVELGGDKGVGSMALAAEGDKVYSCDIRDGWEYVKNTNIVKIVGSSLEVKWPIDLHKVGLWLIDSDHSREHVQKEIDRYLPYWKNTVIMFDDVHYYREVFEAIPLEDKYYEGDMNYDKVVGLRGNGWGVICA